MTAPRLHVIVVAALASCALACHGPERRALPEDAPTSLRQEATACDRGDPQACTNLGAAWRDGSAGRVDEEHAQTLLMSACSAGAALACIGAAVALDDASAAELLTQNCDLEPIACLRLGQRVAESDAGAAFHAFERACEARLLEGCTMAAIMRRDGRGTPADPETAFSDMRRTCGHGSMPACRETAREMLAPTSPAHDPETALDLLQRACTGGDAESCAMTAARFDLEGTAESERQATIFRARACELAWEPACGVRP